MWLKFILLCAFAFTRSMTTSFDLRSVVNGDSMGAVPLGLTLGAGELDVEGICTEPGLACQNCTHTVTCIRLPVGWLKVPLEQCADGFTCNAHLGQCSKQPVPECEDRAQAFQHTCEQVGIFPDAFDCRKFHLCSPPEGLPDGRPADHRPALCPRHYGYNPQTAQCSIPLTHGQCEERPAPLCNKLGQHGVLSASTNHYYVCLLKRSVLHPQIFICPHGWHFWGDFCRPEPEKKIDSSEETSTELKPTTETTAVLPATTSKIEGFFSTEKATTYPADTFLADKIDLANYETNYDDVMPNNEGFVNSFENGDDFW